MNIPDCYDPIYQAERRESEADRNVLICETCHDPIYDEYWEIGCELLCEYCAAKKYRKEVQYVRKVDGDGFYF